MDTIQLTEILQTDAFTSKSFSGVYAIDQLPKAPLDLRKNHGFVINTDRSTGPGKHWVALFYRGDGLAVYFDSFALSYKQYPAIETFIIDKLKTTKITANSRLIQHPFSSVCGVYATYFLLMLSRGHTLTRVLSSFSPTRLRDNDRKATQMVRGLTKKTIPNYYHYIQF